MVQAKSTSPESLETALRVVTDADSTAGLAARAQLEKSFAARYALTDAGNSERLAFLYDEKIKWTEGMGWLVWDGKRWMRDRTKQVERSARDVVRTIGNEAASEKDDDKRKEILRHAVRSESFKKILAMIDGAKCDVSCLDGEFDAHPHLLNLENGTYDLHTQTLKPHDPGDLITKLAPVAYDPEATCQKMDSFMDRIFGGDPELIAFVWRAIGSALLGEATYQGFFLLHGGGANGKSTLLEVYGQALGDYAHSTPTDTFMQGRIDGNGPRPELLKLKGARLVTAIEVNEGRTLNAGTIKSITGGDTISVRTLHKEPIEFRPGFKLFVAVNHRPVIRDTSSGMWRRVYEIPFQVEIPQNEQRDFNELVADLLTEKSGILNRMLEGYQDFKNNKLQPPETVKAATGDYQESMDTVKGFLSDCCEIDAGNAGFSTRGKELFEAYRVWCDGSGIEPKTGTAFGVEIKKHLENQGVENKKTNTGRLYLGLKLRV